MSYHDTKTVWLRDIVADPDQQPARRPMFISSPAQLKLLVPSSEDGRHRLSLLVSSDLFALFQQHGIRIDDTLHCEFHFTPGADHAAGE